MILTGRSDTADLFRSWKPDLVLFAETSGKNALIITPHADIDLAVADLVESAFGHGGQKCSAASLAILVGDVYTSERFRRQLIDAVESIELGVSTDITTTMGPWSANRTIGSLEVCQHSTPARTGSSRRGSCRRRRSTALVARSPRRRRSRLMVPRNRVFRPGARLIHAADLDEAIRIQNASEFGLTGGIHTLDPGEIDHWIEQVEVGNAYVNRPITGAIVQRQPFGGWKRSAVGPARRPGDRTTSRSSARGRPPSPTG